MWLKLKDMPIEQPNVIVGLEDDDEVSDINKILPALPQCHAFIVN
jgi:hypothetical protein